MTAGVVVWLCIVVAFVSYHAGRWVRTNAIARATRVDWRHIWLLEGQVRKLGAVPVERPES